MSTFAPVSCDATPLAGDEVMIVFYGASAAVPRVGESMTDATYGSGWLAFTESGKTLSMPFGSYRVCALYNRHAAGEGPIDRVDQIVCTSLAIDSARVQQVSLPPPAITSPR